LPRTSSRAEARKAPAPKRATGGKPARKAKTSTATKGSKPDGAAPEAAAPVRAFWSGTITFGLVSIPVDLFAAVRPRRKSMKMVDTDGRPLGRQFYCPEDDAKLSSDDMVRGYETDDGKMVVVTDEELDAIAPEATRDIDLRRFVPLEQIPPMYFQRPYFLAPAGRSTKAYHLLSATMERTGRVGIGTFVMRSHEYLVAILSEGGVLRAETLRFADELRSPADLDLEPPGKAPAKRKAAFAKEIAALTREELDMVELGDRQAQALREVAQDKEKRGEDLVDLPRAADEEESEGAEIVDLMQILRRSLSKKAVVTTAESSGSRPAPTDIASARSRVAAKANSKESNTVSGKTADAGDELEDLSREELYKRAQELQIAGRSKMSRTALLEALRAAA
jgi:DNA end-binding protein Ku